MNEFAAMVLKHDPVAVMKLACATDAPAANDPSFDWQAELANDPGYLAWLDREAEIEDYRHARW